MTGRVVGIDLGTSNSAVATTEAGGRQRPVEILRVEQTVAPGEVGARTLLPSALYLPGEHELAEGALSLPGASRSGRWGCSPATRGRGCPAGR